MYAVGLCDITSVPLQFGSDSLWCGMAVWVHFVSSVVIAVGMSYFVIPVAVAGVDASMYV